MKPNGTYYVLVNKKGETYKDCEIGKPEITVVFDTKEEAEEELEDWNWYLQAEDLIDENIYHIEQRYIDFDKELETAKIFNPFNMSAGQLNVCQQLMGGGNNNPFNLNFPNVNNTNNCSDTSVEELKDLVKKVERDYHCKELDSLIDILCTMKFDGELSENDYNYILDHLDEFTNLE